MSQLSPVLAFDIEVFRAIHLGMHREWLDPVMMVITATGLGHLQVIAALSLTKWRSTRPLFWMIFWSWVIVGLSSTGVKRLVPRMRPSNLIDARPMLEFDPKPKLRDGEIVWQWLVDSPRLGSYPSGHTTTSFAIATCIFMFTRKSRYPWVGIAAYVWAGLVGFSRIYVGVHWPTDVIGGALLGSGGGLLIWMMVENLRRRKEMASLG
jgi:undecaprenyl-diphosphatase